MRGALRFLASEETLASYSLDVLSELHLKHPDRPSDRRSFPKAAVSPKDVRFLKIAHFEKILEIRNIYDLDKNFYGNSHCVNAFQARRYLCFGQKIISNV